MMSFRLLALALLLNGSLARAEVNSATAGIRFGVLVAERMLSSPPLPSLDSDNKQHFSIQLAYATGALQYDYGPLTDPNGGGYKGKPSAMGGGLGYTSKSSGKLSYFGFGIYTKAKVDVEFIIPVGGPVGLKVYDSQIGSGALALGANRLLMGSLSEPLTLAAFGGLMAFVNNTTYQVDLPAFGGEPAAKFKVESSSTNYGPMAGLQFKIRMGALSLTPYAFHYLDITDHCVSFKMAGTTDSCSLEMNSSFTAAGAMLGIYNFRISAYSKTWSNVDSDDTKLFTYHLNYTFDF